jgi:gliding motility-associated lipoprotein GldH
MKNWTYIFLLSSLLLVGCDQNVVFENNIMISPDGWKQDEVVQFEWDITDTISLHNFYVSIRNGEGYQYSNIFLFVSMEFPNGKMSVDTIDCPLADTDGHWLGSGLGDLYDNRIIFKERKKFPMAGHYRITIQQAMREENLEEIHDVGFRLSTLP